MSEEIVTDLGDLKPRLLALGIKSFRIECSDGIITLQITKFTGSATFDRQNRFLLKNARGTLRGMDFHVEFELDEFELTS